MPDAGSEFALRRVSGTWRDAALSGRGVLRLRDRTIEVVTDGGATAREEYPALSGAVWRKGVLTLHGLDGTVELEGVQALDRAWVAIVARACPLPEFTRGLRVLGSRRGGDRDAQSRFFAPLLQARRRLEEETDFDRRLDAFQAPALSERLSQVIAALAAERCPDRAPDRRALEAQLTDAAAAVFTRLRALEATTARARSAPDEQGFVAWRAWVAHVTAVFVAADRSWSAAVDLLPPVRGTGTRGRWWRRSAGLALLVSSGALLLGGHR